MPTATDRHALGRSRKVDALFPAAPPVAGLPRSYARTLHDIKERIGKARLSTVLAANSAAILLYWEIGKVVAARMEAEQWGAKVIDRLAADIRTAYPDMSGFSSRNLHYMRSFATTWTSQPILQQLAAKLPWGHHMVLLDRLDDHATRCWYAARAIEHGWSRSILGLLSAVDDMLKQPDDQPTIGLLLCRGKNELVVEYALRDQRRPMGVADWETQLVEKLPDALKGSLPSIEEIEAALTPPKQRPDRQRSRPAKHGGA